MVLPINSALLADMIDRRRGYAPRKDMRLCHWSFTPPSKSCLRYSQYPTHSHSGRLSRRDQRYKQHNMRVMKRYADILVDPYIDAYNPWSYSI